MDRVKTEEDSEMLLPDQMGSPSVDEGSSGGSSGGGAPVLKKGPWTSAEDAFLLDYVKKHGEGNWNAVQKNTGLLRCGKSCRLRWANHLRPNLKKGAFTPEEEDRIIVLHAQIGNKWARMAGSLPGRTDNEIKNFWNTRVKRCQRNGLPLYPSNICHQVPNEDEHNVSEFPYSKKRSSEHLQENARYMHNITRDNLFATPESSYAQALTNFPLNGIFDQSFGYNNYVFAGPVNNTKPLRESEILIPGGPGLSSTATGMLTSIYNYPYHADQSIMNLDPFGVATMGSHALLNGDFATSGPMLGPVKTELPSIQYTGADPSSLSDYGVAPAAPFPELADSFIQSPATATPIESECISARSSSDLLESLLHQAPSLIGGENQPSVKNANFSTVAPGDMVVTSKLDPCHEFFEYGDPVSPLSHCCPVSGDALDDSSAFLTPPSSGTTMAAGKFVQDPGGISPCPENRRADALLESSWLDEGSPSTKDQLIFCEAIAAILGDDVCNDYKPLPSGA